MLSLVFRTFSGMAGALLLLSLEAFGAPLEAIPGEYVVEFLSPEGPQGVAASRAMAAAATFPGRSLGLNTRLVAIHGKSSSAPVSAARAVNSSDSFCAGLPKSVVKSCSPNFVVRTRKTGNDPLLTNLWGLGSTSGADARSAWDVTTGSKDVVVAVLDSGVDYSHPDLAANMWRNPGEIPSNGIDDDHNGYTDDVHGIDAITGTGDPRDLNGHGTHVSGTIGAVGDNGIGLVGVNWATNLMALRFLDADGSGTIADAIEALNYVIAMRERGVNIRAVNASWGGGGHSDPFVSALERLNELGIVFVAAAGNESADNDVSPSYPSNYEVPNVVAVGALTEDQNLADFSNFGATTVDIGAPGDEILSTIPGGNYTRLSGTSMATPHVAGAVALLTAHEPSLEVDAVVRRLVETGVPLPSLAGITTSGRALSLGRLLRGDASPVTPPSIEERMCVYEVTKSRYGRDTSADAAPVIQRGDELGFVEVQLPFDFPFHRDTFSTVTVSPNGVLYMGSGPGEGRYDFESNSAAPRRSIAAFHTDLVASGAGSGVRVATSPQQATFRWVANLYGFLDGQVEVTLTLFPNGTIRDSIEFTSPFVEVIAQMGTTIGLAGSIPESAFTFASGGNAIKSGLELTFTPLCSGATPVHTTDIRLSPANRAGAKTIHPGERFWVDLRTDRPGGSVELGLLVNGKACPLAAKSVSVSSGVARLHGSTRILKSRPGVSHLGVFSQSVVSQRKIAEASGLRKRSAHRLSLGAVCRAIQRTVRPIRR